MKGQPAGISDSMEQKTSHTKDSKQDSSINTTNINEQSGISGTLSKKPSSTIPKTFVELQDDRDKQSESGNVSQNLGVRKQYTSPNSRFLNIQKKLVLTIHSIKIQISSNIDLKLCCTANDSEMAQSEIRRVEQTTRTANFSDEVVEIALD